MDNDLLLVLGIVVCAVSIPSLFAAFSEGRAPRVGGILVVAGLIAISAAVMRHPGGYSFAELPDVFYRVIGRLMN